MRLWTIQPENVWKTLQENGYFVCNAAATNNADFFCAYNWLTEQMEKRIGERPDDAIYPIWAWHTSDWQQKEPDLNEPGYKEKGTKCVCLELEIQDDRVLLSDFDAWHFVLNEWYLDDATNDMEWKEIHRKFDKLPAKKQKELTRKSWQKIFDTSVFCNDWMQRGRYVQATFWKLYLSDVKDVHHFVCQ